MLATMAGNAMELQSVLVGLCKAGRTLDKSEVAHCEQLAELVKGHLSHKAADLMRASQNRPLLYSYASDAMGIVVACEAHTSGPQQMTITRKGKVLMEFLMQRGMLKSSTAAGEMAMATLMADPLPLTKGKKAANMFVAASQFHPMLRKSGHQHICISHAAFDRLLIVPLDRLMKQRRAAFYSPLHGPTISGNTTLLQLMDWHVTTGCCLHDSSNGLKWGTVPYARPGVVEDLHISIESLRNGFGFIHPHIGLFLSRHLRYSAAQIDEEEVAQFWTTLGVEPQWLEELCHINPRWRDGSLWVNEALQQDPSGFDRVSSMILYMLQWKQFSATRWATVGSACRYLMRSLSVGLEQLVKLTKEDPNVSEVHLAGFARCRFLVKKYACVASVAAFPLEAFLLEVMEDDRLCRNLPALEACVLEELSCLERISNASWDRLAEVVQDCSGSQLQSAALLSAHASVAFLDKRVFQVARGFPWKLTQGDIAANLEALSESNAAVADPTTAQIKSLLGLGYNRAALVDAVALLREVPWSTLGVEQAHGSVACIHKLHKGCGVETITCRALLHQARHLFVPSPEATKDEQAKVRIERLRRSAKRPVSARNLFFKDFVAGVAPADAVDSGAAGSRWQLQALTHSQQAFDLLDPSSTHAYTNLAQQATLRKQKRLQEDIEHEMAARSLKQARAQEAAETLGKTSHTSNCRFDRSDFESMRAELAAGKYERSEVKALRAKCLEAPGQLTAQQLGVLDSFAVEPLTKDPPMPDWAKVVCNHREAFHGCALLAASEDYTHTKAYLVMYALKSPMTAMFLTLDFVNAKVPVIAGVPFEELQFKVASYYVHNYTYAQGAYIAAQGLPFEGAGDEIFVLDDLTFMGDTWLCTNAPFVPFKVFTAHLPAPSKAKAEGDRKPAQRSSISSELLVQFPWLADYLPQARGKASSASASTSPGQHEQVASAKGDHAFARAAEAEPGEATTEEAVDSAWAALEQRRQEWANAPSEVGDHFSVQLRGGPLATQRKAMPYESVVAIAKAGAPRKWAETYHMGKQISFAVKKFGAAAAHAMALEWRRRCEFYYQMWLSQSEKNYMYTPADLASYEEDFDWTSFMGELDVESPNWQRASQVMAMQPRLA